MKKYYKNSDKYADEEIRIMKEKCKSREFDESYIRKIVADQKGELSVNSIYWKEEKISAGNWSKIEDEKIKNLDEEVVSSKYVDAKDVLLGLEDYPKEGEYRKNNAEYVYVFIPSFYAVMSLIKYYLKNKEEALKIYNLKNAVVRKDKEIYYGGLPFVLKYLEELLDDDSIDDIKSDFEDIMEELIDCKRGLEINKENDKFIKNIVDCIKKSKCKSLILEKRIKDYEYSKDKYIEYKIIDDYKILMHRDVEKDWKHLKEGQIKKANEIIDNTPKFPKNEPPKNDPLKANIKGWFSQRVSQKDRVVYKKDATGKNYICCDCM